MSSETLRYFTSSSGCYDSLSFKVRNTIYISVFPFIFILTGFPLGFIPCQFCGSDKLFSTSSKYYRKLIEANQLYYFNMYRYIEIEALHILKICFEMTSLSLALVFTRFVHLWKSHQESPTDWKLVCYMQQVSQGIFLT